MSVPIAKLIERLEKSRGIVVYEHDNDANWLSSDELETVIAALRARLTLAKEGAKS